MNPAYPPQGGGGSETNVMAWRPGAEKARSLGAVTAEESCGNDGAMNRLENQNQVFHPLHSSLEISQRRRDSHISTAPTTLGYRLKTENPKRENCSMGMMEKWKSKIRIPTFPPSRQPAAQGQGHPLLTFPAFYGISEHGSGYSADLGRVLRNLIWAET